VLLVPFTAVLLPSFTAVLLVPFTAVLLPSFTAVLLVPFTAVLLAPLDQTVPIVERISRR